MSRNIVKTIEILLIEDSPSDARLLAKFLQNSSIPNHLQIVENGIEALAFLHHQGVYDRVPRPDLIILDLDLPKQDGRSVLAAVKTDPDLSNIPIIIFTTSTRPSDIQNCYQMDANCYLRKPDTLQEFSQIIAKIEEFWLNFAKFPTT